MRTASITRRGGSAVIYKKKTSDVYLKSFIKNGDANANERWLRRRNIYVPQGVPLGHYSPTMLRLSESRGQVYLNYAEREQLREKLTENM